jgi:hypothetical protein
VHAILAQMREVAAKATELVIKEEAPTRGEV